uniref:Col_cuticle_N domain-containing protein n=1 Tax=Caenorhabditis japonica TaxID=281687 RepID=A0A8R1HUF1_CAEJA
MESSIDLRLKAYRFIAYCSVGFSITAAVSLCLTLPLIFSYVENTKTQLTRESSYCRSSVQDMWSEMNNVNVVHLNRTARQAGYSSGGAADAGAGGSDGNPGTAGPPGNPGGEGEKGICPKYCAIDGGIFFEDGTRR